MLNPTNRAGGGLSDLRFLAGLSIVTRLSNVWQTSNQSPPSSSKKPMDCIKMQVCFYLLYIRNLTLVTISSGTRFEHSTVQDKSPIPLCSERFERDYCDYNIDTLLVPNEKVGILGLCCQVLAEAYANATGCRSRCHTMLEIPKVQKQCLV